MSNGIRRVHRVAAIVFAGVVATFAGPLSADAAKSGGAILTTDTVTFGFQYPGHGINYSGGAHANDVNVHIGDDEIVFHDENAVGLTANSPCVVEADGETVTCPKYANSGSSSTDPVFSVTVLGNDGGDTLTSSGFGMVHGSTFRPLRVTLSGWGGHDTITATGGWSYLVGGPGDDVLTSGPGSGTATTDRILGSEGNDTIYASATYNSADADGIYCDTQYDQSYTDILVRGSNDTVYGYFIPPNGGISSGCDIVTVE